MIEYQYSELDLIEIYIYKSILFKIKNYIVNCKIKIAVDEACIILI